MLLLVVVVEEMKKEVVESSQTWTQNLERQHYLLLCVPRLTLCHVLAVGVVCYCNMMMMIVVDELVKSMKLDDDDDKKMHSQFVVNIEKKGIVPLRQLAKKKVIDDMYLVGHSS